MITIACSCTQIFMAVVTSILYSLKFSRGKYFVVLANSAQKQIFADKIFRGLASSHAKYLL